MNVRKLSLGVGLFATAGLATLFGAPAVGDATEFCIVCGSTTADVSIKFQGVTAENRNTIGTGVDNGSCSGTSGTGNCKETTWGVGFLTSVIDKNSNTLWANGVSGPHQQVAFMLSGIADEAIDPTSTGFTIYNKGSSGAQTANYGSGNVNITGDGNIHIRLFSYDGNAPNLDALHTSGRTGAETFNGVTNVSGGELMADFELIPGIVAPGTLDAEGHDVSNATMVQDSTSTTDPATAHGNFYADCVSGYACGSGAPPASTTNQFNNNGVPDAPLSSIIAAIFGAFTAVPGDTLQLNHGWGEFINDPDLTATPFAVPEPMSLLLLGSMLLTGAGVMRFRRRRNTL